VGAQDVKERTQLTAVQGLASSMQAVHQAVACVDLVMAAPAVKSLFTQHMID
jgi:hypothetical protein